MERNSDLASKHLRIVYRGRIVTDYIRIHTIVPVVDSNIVESANSENAPLLNDPDPFYLHCVVSDTPLSAHTAEAEIVPSRGFDRLLQMGLDEEEVNTLRAQFHAIRGTNATTDHTMEDNWIDNAGAAPTQCNDSSY